jgi:hypothetical protein
MTIDINVYGDNVIQFEVEPDTRVSSIVGQLKRMLQIPQLSLCMVQTIAGQIEELYLDEEQLVRCEL